MDDRLFEEMLQEIDAMTPEEYWSLYREAEQLANFPPEDTGFIPVQFTTIPVVDSHHIFDNTFDTEVIPVPQASTRPYGNRPPDFATPTPS
jgi:hypothetical protein